MDSEQMSQWSEELNSVNRCLDLLQDNIDNSPIILPGSSLTLPAFVKDDVDRKKHLKRIKNLSPWQKVLIDPELLKESENL